MHHIYEIFFCSYGSHNMQLVPLSSLAGWWPMAIIFQGRVPQTHTSCFVVFGGMLHTSGASYERWRAPNVQKQGHFLAILSQKFLVGRNFFYTARQGARQPMKIFSDDLLCCICIQKIFWSHCIPWEVSTSLETKYQVCFFCQKSPLTISLLKPNYKNLFFKLGFNKLKKGVF